MAVRSKRFECRQVYLSPCTRHSKCDENDRMKNDKRTSVGPRRRAIVYLCVHPVLVVVDEHIMVLGSAGAAHRFLDVGFNVRRMAGDAVLQALLAAYDRTTAISGAHTDVLLVRFGAQELFPLETADSGAE